MFESVIKGLVTLASRPVLTGEPKINQKTKEGCSPAGWLRFFSWSLYWLGPSLQNPCAGQLWVLNKQPPNLWLYRLPLSTPSRLLWLHRLPWPCWACSCLWAFALAVVSPWKACPWDIWMACSLASFTFLLKCHLSKRTSPPIALHAPPHSTCHLWHTMYFFVYVPLLSLACKLHEGRGFLYFIHYCIRSD